MKSQVSPAVVVVAIVVVIAAVFGIYWFATGGPRGEQAVPPPMPPNVQAEFAKRMGNSNVTGPRNAGGPGGGGMPPGASGGMTAPMTGR